MSNKQIFITLLIPCFAISCATGPGEKEKINIEGKWEFEGLEQLVIINQKNAKYLLIGLSGSFMEANVIRKSTDSGETWDTVLEGNGIYTFTQSALDPEIVYASGRNQEGHLFFLASNNFGDTWQTLEHPESPSNIYVNDMVSIMEDNQEVIYLGTNKGLYSFTVD